jgi:uncharacterized membrane protein YozB (DUF420 family)
VNFSDLPAVNATLNGITTILLSLGLYFILRKNIRAHYTCMLSALCCSILFLICYLTYHFKAHFTRFTNPPGFRPIYLTLLATHTFLAVIIVPLVIITLSRALRQRFDLHKKIARWTWPIWMYVSVTGVIIYLLLYKIFPQTR